jgi:putative SOS response-associated peptidase YedK
MCGTPVPYAGRLGFSKIPAREAIGNEAIALPTMTRRPVDHVLTTEPNELAQQIHDRMPVIVGPAHYADWLDTARSGTLADCSFLGPYPAGEMRAVAVSTHVNSPKNNDPACLTPVTAGTAE